MLEVGKGTNFWPDCWRCISSIFGELRRAEEGVIVKTSLLKYSTPALFSLLRFLVSAAPAATPSASPPLKYSMSTSRLGGTANSAESMLGLNFRNGSSSVETEPRWEGSGLGLRVLAGVNLPGVLKRRPEAGSAGAVVVVVVDSSPSSANNREDSCSRLCSRCRGVRLRTLSLVG